MGKYLKERSIFYNTYLAILVSTYGIFSSYNSSIFNLATTSILKKIYNLEGEKLDNAHGNIFLFDTIGIIVSMIVSYKVVTKTWKRTLVIKIAAIAALLVYPLTITKSLEAMYTGRFLTGISQGLNLLVLFG